MQKLIFSEFRNILSKRASVIHEGANLPHITGVIVYSEDNWKEEYPLSSRSYRTSSAEKYFGSWYGGSSMYGRSLDGSDFARLDYCNWKIDYCYLEEE